MSMASFWCHTFLQAVLVFESKLSIHQAAKQADELKKKVDDANRQAELAACFQLRHQSH